VHSVTLNTASSALAPDTAAGAGAGASAGAVASAGAGGPKLRAVPSAAQMHWRGACCGEARYGRNTRDSSRILLDAVLLATVATSS
jgi:hypothetical protein